MGLKRQVTSGMAGIEMSFPSVPSNYQQERLGIMAVTQAITNLGLIWRETPMADVGIDGQVEYVSVEGKATGRLLAAQVKSGISYFHDHETEWRFYPEDKHRLYWERFPLPVILFLHHPEQRVVYWADARHQLRSPSTSNERYIAVPKKQRLDQATTVQLFEATGATVDPFLDIPEVFYRLVRSRSNNESFPVSYFGLFVHGLTNICRTLFFSMDVAMTVAEFNLIGSKAETGVGVGPGEHDFLMSYIRFIVSQHIADVDFADCLIDWYDREMQPKFFAPITSRGRQLLSLIAEREQEFRFNGILRGYSETIHVVQESLVGLQMTPGTIARYPLVSAFIAECEKV